MADTGVLSDETVRQGWSFRSFGENFCSSYEAMVKGGIEAEHSSSV